MGNHALHFFYIFASKLLRDNSTGVKIEDDRDESFRIYSVSVRLGKLLIPWSLKKVSKH